jgi:nickel transport protein
MKIIKRGLVIGVVGLFLVILPGAGWAQEESTDADRQAVVTLLKAQNKKMSGDLRRIQREIAALRADLAKPGIKDAFAGIGYIFGLFGVAAYVASRRKD